MLIGNLRDIKHPARRDPYFGNNFLILGAVVGFKPVDIDMIKVWKKGVSFESLKKGTSSHRLDASSILDDSIHTSLTEKKETFPTGHVREQFCCYSGNTSKTNRIVQDVKDFLWRPMGTYYYFEWNISHGWVYNGNVNSGWQ